MQLRTAVRSTCIALQLLLLAKAAVVAVFSPDDVWPAPGPQEAATIHFVGLISMFGCLFSSLLSSFVQAYLASKIIKWKQAGYEADAEAREEATRPLLQPEDGTEGRKSDKATAKAKKAAVSNKTVSELIAMALPDLPINCIALAAGCVAALGSALVPYYTGQVIDYASIEPDQTKFLSTCWRLVLVAALCGVFTGIRGGLFTLTMTRLNVRIRKRLFHALIQVGADEKLSDQKDAVCCTRAHVADPQPLFPVGSQMEMGFYDMNKTGDISSRLSADTTSVSDQARRGWF